MTNLNATEVKKIAKELKVKNWWNKRRDDLVKEIAEIKGWSDETPEVIEYLLAGGEIKELPYGPETQRDIPTQESAGMKQPTRKKPTKKARKSTPEKIEKKRADDVVTLSEICTELEVEGRVARRKLRTSGIPKPGKQWEWNIGHEDIQKVKDLLGSK